MNSELALLKFINHYTGNSLDNNGHNYNEEQADLIETFIYSLEDKIHPKEFENSIIENEMKLRSRIKDTSKVKISLTPLQITHFNLLYNIVYIKWFNPKKLLNFNFSEDLSELLDNEDKIIELYDEVRKISLN